MASEDSCVKCRGIRKGCPYISHAMVTYPLLRVEIQEVEIQ